MPWPWLKGKLSKSNCSDGSLILESKLIFPQKCKVELDHRVSYNKAIIGVDVEGQQPLMFSSCFNDWGQFFQVTSNLRNRSGSQERQRDSNPNPSPKLVRDSSLVDLNLMLSKNVL